MKVVGDCTSDGTIRVEGRVEGSVRAAKSVVVGKDGMVKGDISTQDAIIAGRVNGSVSAESRIELLASCRVQGDITSRRIKLEEGGQVDGQLHMGASETQETSQSVRQSVHGDLQAGGEKQASAQQRATKVN